MTKYCSISDPLFQEHPVYFRRSSFQLRDWTDTVFGYLYEAKKLSRLIDLNARLSGQPYRWICFLNIEPEYTADEQRQIWTTISRNFRRQKIVALWVREISATNRVQYNILGKSPQQLHDVERAIQKSIPQNIPHHKQIDHVHKPWRLARYIVKAKVAGWNKRTGEFTDDVWASKRRLFRPNTGLRKYGVIGQFWFRPKEALWEVVQQYEQHITDTILRHPELEQQAHEYHELIDGHFTLSKIVRSLAVFHHAENSKSVLSHGLAV